MKHSEFYEIQKNRVLDDSTINSLKQGDEELHSEIDIADAFKSQKKSKSYHQKNKSNDSGNLCMNIFYYIYNIHHIYIFIFIYK